MRFENSFPIENRIAYPINSIEAKKTNNKIKPLSAYHINTVAIRSVIRSVTFMTASNSILSNARKIDIKYRLMLSKNIGIDLLGQAFYPQTALNNLTMS